MNELKACPFKGCGENLKSRLWAGDLIVSCPKHTQGMTSEAWNQRPREEELEAKLKARDKVSSAALKLAKAAANYYHQKRPAGSWLRLVKAQKEFEALGSEVLS